MKQVSIGEFRASLFGTILSLFLKKNKKKRKKKGKKKPPT